MSSHMALKAYGASQNATRTPRDIEYGVFAKITAALGSATKGRDRIEAIHRNRELWTFIATMVSDSDNSLPADLRARLFYLHEFTETHSRQVLSGQADVDALLDVNRAIMAGLAGPGQSAA